MAEEERGFAGDEGRVEDEDRKAGNCGIKGVARFGEGSPGIQGFGEFVMEMNVGKEGQNGAVGKVVVQVPIRHADESRGA